VPVTIIFDGLKSKQLEYDNIFQFIYQSSLKKKLEILEMLKLLLDKTIKEIESLKSIRQDVLTDEYKEILSRLEEGKIKLNEIITSLENYFRN
jgi:hypothetical protein